MSTPVLAAGLVLALAFSVPASAQSIEDHPLRLATIVFAGAAATDWTTTYRNLTRGSVDSAFTVGHESNPLLTPFLDRPVPTVLAGAAMDAAGVWLWNRYIGRKHPKFAAVGLYVAAGLRVALAEHNVRHQTNLCGPVRGALVCVQ